MDKYLEIWEPVLRSFEGSYEEECLRFDRPIHKVVDWYPSGYLEITVKLSNGCLYKYEFIGSNIIPIRVDDNLDELRNSVHNDEEAWRKNFARRLYIKMQKRGVSQEQLSNMTGISKVTLSKYTNGQATPSGYNLDRLSQALCCSVSELTAVY